jgi:hypothetical protein
MKTPMVRRLLSLIVLATSVLVIGSWPALAGTARVKIAPKGTIVAGGQSVLATVRVSCDPIDEAAEPLEAFLTLSQDDQTISGDGSINGVVCNGKPRRFEVTVTAFEGTFHRGIAFASAFVLVCNESGSVCEDGQDTRNIKLRNGA